MDISSAEKLMQDAIRHLEEEFSKMQVGRASTSMVETLPVDAYGMTQPMRNLCTITTPDPKTILMQPWDKTVLSAMEKAIRERSDLGFNPLNDGNVLRINIPQPTEERRKELGKVARVKGEETKISVRNARQKAHAHIQEQLKSKSVSEDMASGEEKKLQDAVDRHNKKIEDMVKAKETDILKI
jgi:ribosome recycling factor